MVCASSLPRLSRPSVAGLTIGEHKKRKAPLPTVRSSAIPRKLRMNFIAVYPHNKIGSFEIGTEDRHGPDYSLIRAVAAGIITQFQVQYFREAPDCGPFTCVLLFRNFKQYIV